MNRWKAKWVHWRTEYQAQIDEIEKELAQYHQRGLLVAPLQPGEKPTDTTDQRIAECHRLIDLYRGIIKSIDEKHLA